MVNAASLASKVALPEASITLMRALVVGVLLTCHVAFEEEPLKMVL